MRANRAWHWRQNNLAGSLSPRASTYRLDRFDTFVIGTVTALFVTWWGWSGVLLVPVWAASYALAGWLGHKLKLRAREKRATWRSG